MTDVPEGPVDINGLVTKHLRDVASELRPQAAVGAMFPPNVLQFDETMEQIDEFIDVNELGLAYENLVCMLEDFPFLISGKSAVRLLEVGLLFEYKTESPEDRMFDRRQA